MRRLLYAALMELSISLLSMRRIVIRVIMNIVINHFGKAQLAKMMRANRKDPFVTYATTIDERSNI